MASLVIGCYQIVITQPSAKGENYADGRVCGRG